MTQPIHRNSLKPGHRLHWYHIERVLGQGGFGITYLARDSNLKHEVAIKEYLPIELAVREQDSSVQPASDTHGERFKWGLDRFLTEAQTLARFKHPNIVRVLTVFEASGTGYMVMEYEQGDSLHDILTRRQTLEEAEILNIVLPILGGLEKVHERGFIHRDIKPANIFAGEIGQGRYSQRFLNAIDHALQFRPKDRPQTVAEWRRVRRHSRHTTESERLGRRLDGYDDRRRRVRRHARRPTES